MMYFIGKLLSVGARLQTLLDLLVLLLDFLMLHTQIDSNLRTLVA